MYWLDKQEDRHPWEILWMSKKVFVVTWTNSVVGQVGSEDIKCFEDYNTALGFAKLMKQSYTCLLYTSPSPRDS